METLDSNGAIIYFVNKYSYIDNAISHLDLNVQIRNKHIGIAVGIFEKNNNTSKREKYS